jgi:hypothetical protein
MEIPTFLYNSSKCKPSLFLSYTQYKVAGRLKWLLLKFFFVKWFLLQLLLLKWFLLQLLLFKMVVITIITY